MTKTETLPAVQRPDADLVAESLRGSRDAFREIVERYQTLICSVAYSATGRLSQSEDVAQETFITAWAQLRSLREPAKLRNWLCGIVRHCVQRSLRDEQREPVGHAGPLDDISNSPAPDAMPSDQAISREEEVIMWRALDKVPELYREPLILFYRQHQSIEQVAVALELSPDAVKQRLSRGRKLLQDEVQAFVENTLRRSAPGRAFSIEVLALLPMMVAPAAAGGAVAGMKGSAAAKSGVFAACLAPLAPFLGIAAGVGAQWLVIQQTVPDGARRRKYLGRVVVAWIAYIALAVGGEAAVHWLGRTYGWSDAIRFTAVIGFWWWFVAMTLTLQMAVLSRLRARHEHRSSAAAVEAGRPFSPGTLALVIAGFYLAMFSWLIAFAWRVGDPHGAAMSVGAMLLLGVWTYVDFRNLGTTPVGKLLGRHVMMVGAVILLILNLRTDVWVGIRYGITVAEAQRTLPTWIVPVLTVALIGWSALVYQLTSASRDVR